MHKQPIGIIAGKGSLPIEISQTCRQLGMETIIAAVEINDHIVEFVNTLSNKRFDTEFLKALDRASEFAKKISKPVNTLKTKVSLESEEIRSPFNGYKPFAVGQVGSIIDYFKHNNVKNIIFAGAIKRPDLTSLKLDFTGGLLLAKIIRKKYLGDDELLKTIADFLESKGFKIISPHDILSLSIEKNLSTIKPTKQDMTDIELGFKVVNNLGELDIGQAVVIENGYVLGVEAAEGTDNLIKRCAILRKRSTGAVLIKSIKPDQDKRFDIPTIGPDTILNLIKNNYNGLAIKKDEVIILEQNKTFELANRNKLFIAIS